MAYDLLIFSVLAVPAACSGEVTLLSQQRTIEAVTTFDGQVQTASAPPGFAPFAASVAADATFPTPDGGTGTNQAVASINCLVDPNAIRASGSLAGQGGFAVTGQQPAAVFGEAAALVLVQFQLDVATDFELEASRRASENPRDEYEIELTNLDTGAEVVAIAREDATDPIARFGTLAPGRYQFQYELEVTAQDATASTYGLTMSLVSPCGRADVGRVGGAAGADNVLDNNDFVAFIDRFFAGDPVADLGTTGGLAGGDGVLDNNDFVVFVGHFFDAPPACR